MVADGVASRRIRTDQILARHGAGRYGLGGTGAFGETSLDYRADYQELKQELGLGHYEGRGWRGFHHHATLCIAAYGFLVAERSRFSPSARAGNVGLPAPKLSPDFRPRGSPRSSRAA